MLKLYWIAFNAEELRRLTNRGADEIVIAVTHTLEGLMQTLKNHHGLSALLDGDYDTWLGGREREVSKLWASSDT